MSLIFFVTILDFYGMSVSTIYSHDQRNFL